jgi:hypothetical protein
MFFVIKSNDKKLSTLLPFKCNVKAVMNLDVTDLPLFLSRIFYAHLALSFKRILWTYHDLKLYGYTLK